ncbi:glycoside hydrolase family 76 protein [Streptomyces mirabilis]|uniref:glycoside hydrolase family 76 protein n=1 Tax=Streptomyces mirabilis TaxID=68239 RepID=UPI0036DA80AA
MSRGIAAYAALERHLASKDGSGLVRERYPAASGDNAYSYEWPYAQVHIAALDLAAVDARYAAEVAERAKAREHYWNAGGGATELPGYDSYPRVPYGSGGDMFYDENEWVGLAKVQLHLQTGNSATLARAEGIFDLVSSGWDTDSTHAAPGGVFWTQANWSQDRNTVSNMPGAQLALRLLQITGEDCYPHWARRLCYWTDTYPTTGKDKGSRTVQHVWINHLAGVSHADARSGCQVRQRAGPGRRLGAKAVSAPSTTGLTPAPR